MRRMTKIPMLRRVAYKVLMILDWSSEGEQMFRQIISKWRGVYIDVGAYIGDTTIIAEKAKAIIAIEPVPQYVEILQRLSQKDNRIRVIPAPAGDGSTLEFLQLPGCDSMFAEARMFKKWAPKSKTVNRIILKTIKIDDIHIPEGDLLIKIDAEGGELRILKGAEKTINERNPLLLIECHGTYDQVADLLTKYGYKFHTFAGFKPFKGQCYLVATRKR